MFGNLIGGSHAICPPSAAIGHQRLAWSVSPLGATPPGRRYADLAAETGGEAAGPRARMLGVTMTGAMSRAGTRMDELAAEREISGVARVTRGGAVEFERVYGLANRADAIPVQVGTRFGLASLTKMFTAVTVVSLVRDGRLTFDARVVDVLPPGRRPATLRPGV